MISRVKYTYHLWREGVASIPFVDYVLVCTGTLVGVLLAQVRGLHLVWIHPTNY
jgi:hypothetical protein